MEPDGKKVESDLLMKKYANQRRKGNRGKGRKKRPIYLQDWRNQWIEGKKMCLYRMARVMSASKRKAS